MTRLDIGTGGLRVTKQNEVEFEITGVFPADHGVFAVTTIPTGATGPYEGSLPDGSSKLHYADRSGEVVVRGRRYGFPGKMVFFAIEPVAGSDAPEPGDKLVWTDASA